MQGLSNWQLLAVTMQSAMMQLVASTQHRPRQHSTDEGSNDGTGSDADEFTDGPVTVSCGSDDGGGRNSGSC